ncbi:MAG TPA: anthranilate synthase component I family protein [Methanomicrobia archaeon]|nr:anthranilate synthase component I family protein [Methanomicrobia archaeon]
MEKRILTNTVRKVDVPFTPLELFAKLRGVFNKSFLLESVEGREKIARYSFIGFDPLLEFKAKGQHVELNGDRYTVENPYVEMAQILNSFDCGRVGTLPFSGGLVGFFSYDIVRFFEQLPSTTPDSLGCPDAHFIIPTHLLCFDHLKQEVILVSYKKEKVDLERLERGGGDPNIEDFSVSSPQSEMARAEFEAGVLKAKEYIREGDIFQAVLSRRVAAEYHGDPLSFYRNLRATNPSPYLFYLDFDNVVVGSSPEMLVRLRDGVVTLRPLAGTRRRGRTREEDELLKVDMLLDEKERAEHLMLVDLGRNDLGRVARSGSVEVTELMEIEKYSHVQHIVSNITAELATGRDAFDVFRSSFPAGTVTGAPKIRAMKIIEELEKSRRGIYAGAVGYFDFSGNLDFAISIRTMFTVGHRAYFQAGAGIVADSVPEREFAETENKLGALITTAEGKHARAGH